MYYVFVFVFVFIHFVIFNASNDDEEEKVFGDSLIRSIATEAIVGGDKQELA